MARLLTHHDPYHIHAILGLASLLHFLVRLVVLPLIGWRYDGWHSFVLIHLALSLTSFFFKIPRMRNDTYTIYREMQLHTIVFSLRSLFVYAWALSGGMGGAVMRLILVLFCHYLADVVTAKWGTPTGGTTIRRFDGEKSAYAARPLRDRLGVLAMSAAQLMATWFLLMAPLSSAATVAFAVMLPVQGSAFTATLVRKGKLASYTGGVLYLGLIAVAVAHFPWTLLDCAFIALACVLRFGLRLNKYALWALMVGLATAPSLPITAQELRVDLSWGSLSQQWSQWPLSDTLQQVWQRLPGAGDVDPLRQHLYHSWRGMLDGTADLYVRGNAFIANLWA